MFEAFETQADPQAAKRFAASTGASLAVLGLLAALAVGLAGREVARKLKEPSVDVSFRPPPPPPPPPKVEAPKPKPPPKPKAPPPPPRSVTKPPPAVPPPAAVVAAPAAIVAPKEVPLEKPPEASAEQAVAAIHMAVGGTGDGSGAGSPDGVPGGTGTGPAAPPSRPINLPERAVPSEPYPDNASPEFPPEMRSAGKEAVVILKCVIDEEGRVSVCKAMKGEEPFTSAALRAVRTWRYSPATVDGQPQKHFKIVRVPFRIRS